MIKYILLLCPILFSIAVSAQKVTKPAILRDYYLPDDQLPRNFKAEPLTAEAKETAGINTNPGYSTRKEFISGVYDMMDTSLVKGMLVAIYVPLDKRRANRELGYYVLEYQTAADRAAEMAKLTAGEGKVAYFKDNLLLLTWSDANGFEEQAKAIGDYFAVKLKLKPLNLPDARADSEEAATAE